MATGDERLADLENRMADQTIGMSDLSLKIDRLWDKFDQRMDKLDEKFDHRMDRLEGTLDAKVDRAMAFQLATLLALVGGMMTALLRSWRIL